MRLHRQFDSIDEIIKYFSYKPWHCIVFFIFDKKDENKIFTIKAKKKCIFAKFYAVYYKDDELYVAFRFMNKWEETNKLDAFQNIYKHCEEYIKRIEYKNK